MAKFEVPVVRIRALEPIPGADMIELAVVGDYRSVVQKGLHVVGGLAAYIPEGALLPQPLLQAMGLEGRLAGSDKNRVKAIKLRGCLSQGVLIPSTKIEVNGHEGVYLFADPIQSSVHKIPSIKVEEGQDVAEHFGITKWEPPIPANMGGEVYNAGQKLTVHYDVENFKKFPDVLQEGERVHITEKLHGTCCGVAILPEKDWSEDDVIVDGNHFLVFSKGLGATGLCFKGNDQNKASNLYVRTLLATGTFEKISNIRVALSMVQFDRPVFVMGEVFGVVQDLKYGGGQSFRAFDIAVGYRGDQMWINRALAFEKLGEVEINTVPVLYEGPFSKAVLEQHTNGKETVSGKELHIREGVVVTTVPERQDPTIGRVMLKSVSEAYLLRKNKDATELQ